MNKADEGEQKESVCHYLTTCRVPPPGRSVGGAAGDLHPRHDGAGLHGAAEEETQGLRHEECRPGEVQANVHEFAAVKAWISPKYIKEI